MQVTPIGLDLAKNILQVHGITDEGDVALNSPLRFAQVLTFFKRLNPCLVGMEACGTSHHLAREISELGHEVRLIPPMYVKPYVKRGQSNAIDAEAICEAITRPTMRFVEIKPVDQQAQLSLHRVRGLMVRQRTQLINALRSLLAEFGVYIARGFVRVISFAQGVVKGIELDLPTVAQDVFLYLCQQLGTLHEQVRWYEVRLRQEAKLDARVRLYRQSLALAQ